MGTEHNYFSKTVLNSKSSALLKMSDIVGTVLSQKTRPCSGIEISPFLHGLMLNKVHTMQGDST